MVAIVRRAVRRAMCTWCTKVPGRDGDNYCTDACVQDDADMQTYSM